MKKVMLLLCFTCSAFFAFSQYLPMLDRLEGVWHSASSPTLFASWQFESDDRVQYKLYDLIGTDTIIKNEGQITCNNNVLVLNQFTQNYVADKQVFQHKKTTCDALVLENAGHILSWEIFQSRHLVISEDGREMIFTRVKQRNAVQPVLGLRLFAGIGNTNGFLNKKSPAAALNPNFLKSYQFSPGTTREFGVALDLGFKSNPMHLQVEWGMGQKKFDLRSDLEDQDNPGNRIVQNGAYKVDYTSIALLPTLDIDQKKRFAVQAGIYFALQTSTSFNGSINNQPTNNWVAQPRNGLTGTGGFIVGGIYKIPVSGMSAIHPGLYVRGQFDPGTIRYGTFTAGLSLQLGK